MGMGGPGGGMHVFMWGPSGRQEGKRPSISMYRRLLRYVGPYRWNLVFAAVLLIISTALGLVWPRVVQAVIDLGLKDSGFLDLLILGLVVVLLVRAVIDGVRQFVMAYTGERVIFDLRMAIVRHLQSLSLSFFNRRKTGDLMSHVTSDATLVHGVITQTIIQVLGQVLTLVGGVAVIFLMNWRLALLTLVVAPPIAILGQRMGRRIRDISRAKRRSQKSGSFRRSRARSTRLRASTTSCSSRSTRRSSGRASPRRCSRSSASSDSCRRSSCSGTAAMRSRAAR